MAVLKFCLYILSFALILEFANSKAPTQVTIVETKDMAASMQLDAVDILKRSLDAGVQNPCKTVSDHFDERYPAVHWNCVVHNGYSMHSQKLINMKVGNQKYVLFAVKK